MTWGTARILLDEISTAAPVFNSEGRAIAAVQIPVHAPQWTLEKVREKNRPACAGNGAGHFRFAVGKFRSMASLPSALARNDPVAGVLWMLVSCALISGVAALARYTTLAGVPPMQVVFFRLFFALVTLSPLLLWRGAEMVRTEKMKTYLVRVAIGLTGMTTWFIGLSMVPVGEVTAISFLSPLFATIFAVVLLGEVVRMRRWLATLIGFAGALVILRPGMTEISTGVWLIIFSALSIGLSTTFIKRLTNSDDPDKVVFISTLMMTPVMLVPALWVWGMAAGGGLAVPDPDRSGGNARTCDPGQGLCRDGRLHRHGGRLRPASVRRTLRLVRLRRDHRFVDLGRRRDHLCVQRLHRPAGSQGQRQVGAGGGPAGTAVTRPLNV